MDDLLKEVRFLKDDFESKLGRKLTEQESELLTVSYLSGRKDGLQEVVDDYEKERINFAN